MMLIDNWIAGYSFFDIQCVILFIKNKQRRRYDNQTVWRKIYRIIMI